MNFKHFNISEFYCKCDREHDKQLVSEKLILLLDIARDRASVAFRITSGYRCPEHNNEVDGVSDSAHVKGLAADIKAESSTIRWKILTELTKVGFSRIGIHKSFIHVDIDDSREQEVVWVYV